MITLYGAGPGFGLPEVSPYVTKTEVQLKMAGLTYEKEQAWPDTSPKGQLPWLDDDGEKIADSTFIRAHLERKYGIDFDEGLDASGRGVAWAIERMLENHFGWTVTYFRYLDPANFEKGPARWFDGAPPALADDLRSDLRRQVAATLKAVGIGRHARAEITALGVCSLEALSSILGDKPYVMGRRPCGLDATAFAMLAATLTPFFDSPLRRRAEGFSNLEAYVQRMMAQFYPEHAWEPAETVAA